MFKVSELNPNDKTLDRIHDIQRKIYEQDKNLSSSEKIISFIKVRKEFCKEYNCNFKIAPLQSSGK